MADGATGDLVPLTIKVTTPGNREDLEARMARNDLRNVAEAVETKTAIIVGSGPSARHSALWDRLRTIATIPDYLPKPKVVACNGALSLFIENGLTPDFWSCCDPQDQVLDFIPEHPPNRVVYMLATKCPEALFDSLEDRKISRWRLDDMAKLPGHIHIPCAVSITLVTMNLMRFMGCNRFETYGWDCCYLDGEHHASKQPEPEGKMPFEIQDNSIQGLAAFYQSGRDVLRHRFDVCGSWAAELQDACIQAHNMKAMGYELIVHGPGAVGTFLRAKGLIA